MSLRVSQNTAVKKGFMRPNDETFLNCPHQSLDQTPQHSKVRTNHRGLRSPNPVLFRPDEPEEMKKVDSGTKHSPAFFRAFPRAWESSYLELQP